MLVYVAGPYSGKTKEDVQFHIDQATDVAGELWKKGYAVICPHANTAHFEDKFPTISYDQYLKGDFEIIARCDALLLLPNWQDSKGAREEECYARRAGIPTYIYPDIPPFPPTEVHRPEQSRHFLNTVMKMYRTHLEKNNDYSPANILGTGEIGLATRVWDKVARLLNLTGFHIEISSSSFSAPIQPKNESLDDTLLDLAVYGVIGLLLRKGVWGR